MPDKTALGISEELRQFIEALVEEVVLEGKSFECQKKYLQQFSEAEGINYDTLEKNLAEFFDIMENCKGLHTEGSLMTAKILNGNCCLSEDFVDQLLGKIEKKPIAIDLGLPSGTKWANCNVGATQPWEYGGYYA